MKAGRLFFQTVLAVCLLAACSNEFQSTMDVDIADFQFENQNSEQVGLSDLKGDVWLANFIFTNCTTVCPPMTRNMSDIQDRLNEEDVEHYQMVSFSVDPERDTPETLKTYISHYEADESNWHLLTGYSQKEIGDFAKKSFQALALPDPNSDQFVHGTSFYLVNKEGTVVKSYNGNEDVPYEEIVQDVKKLAGE